MWFVLILLRNSEKLLTCQLCALSTSLYNWSKSKKKSRTMQVQKDIVKQKKISVQRVYGPPLNGSSRRHMFLSFLYLLSLAILLWLSPSDTATLLWTAHDQGKYRRVEWRKLTTTVPQASTMIVAVERTRVKSVQVDQSASSQLPLPYRAAKRKFSVRLCELHPTTLLETSTFGSSSLCRRIALNKSECKCVSYRLRDPVTTQIGSWPVIQGQV